MKKLLALTFLANVILIVIMIFILPSRIAIHFVSGGMPDSWISREAFVLFLLAIELPLFILFLITPALSLKVAPRWINIQNKDYWLKEENLPELKRKLVSLISEFGCALFLLFLFVAILTIDANFSDPIRLKEAYFFPVFIVFMAYVIYWALKFVLSFRLPKEKIRDNQG
jgi:Domain of unknown function (DUF1648)